MEAAGWVIGIAIGLALAWQAAEIGRAAWRRREAKKIEDAAALGWTRLLRPHDDD